ncbi:MAG: hypothetical protein CEE40_03895 [Chloroflexi bacterium B3_Chlor]|nr:MAG: hypothetical protein CEE40_03895 [Chloroflexi bacterium B3_Chlor]
MTASLEGSTRESFKINSGDPLRSLYYIDHHDTEFLVERSSDQLEVYGGPATSPTLLGRITVGSRRSGAIWKADDCTGEYFIDEDGEYVIIPIIDNRKAMSVIRGVDPVHYLLESLTEEAKSPD